MTQQRLLLDTHALPWWLADPKQLSAKAHATIGNQKHQVLVSAASAWELATKVRLGKLEIAQQLLSELQVYWRARGLSCCPFSSATGSEPADTRRLTAIPLIPCSLPRLNWRTSPW